MIQSVATRELHCPNCDGLEFDRVGNKLKTILTHFFDFHHGESPTDLVACHDCGHLEWVLPEDSDQEYFPADEEITCISCGMELTPEQTICPACGWSRD